MTKIALSHYFTFHGSFPCLRFPQKKVPLKGKRARKGQQKQKNWKLRRENPTNLWKRSLKFLVWRFVNICFSLDIFLEFRVFFFFVHIYIQTIKTILCFLCVSVEAHANSEKWALFPLMAKQCLVSFFVCLFEVRSYAAQALYSHGPPPSKITDVCHCVWPSCLPFSPTPTSVCPSLSPSIPYTRGGGAACSLALRSWH